MKLLIVVTAEIFKWSRTALSKFSWPLNKNTITKTATMPGKTTQWAKTLANHPANLSWIL